MQYMLDMLSGALRLVPLDNDRYARAALDVTVRALHQRLPDRQRKEDL